MNNYYEWRTAKVSLFGRTLDVVGCFDYGNFQLLITWTEKRSIKNSITFDIRMNEKNEDEYGIEIEIERWYRIIAIDMSETNFSGVFESAVGFSPTLKSGHGCVQSWNPWLCWRNESREWRSSCEFDKKNNWNESLLVYGMFLSAWARSFVLWRPSPAVPVRHHHYFNY